MLPVELLSISPTDRVFDMCASPGSKTLQILEILSQASPILSSPGYCIASDLDDKRAAMLSHQTLKLAYPGYLILNEDSTIFPSSNIFNKIICDVPCSGDGTTRKNGVILKNWSNKFAIKLHAKQRDLLYKGFELLEKDGLLVYSTCSLNPIENEAVVHSALERYKDKIELLDLEDKTLLLGNGGDGGGRLPGWSPGLTSWKIYSKIKKTEYWFSSYHEVPKEYRSGIEATMFPGSMTSLLHRTRRVYHQAEDTGGFFIALFRKKCEFDKLEEVFIDKMKINEENKEETGEIDIKEEVKGSEDTIELGLKLKNFFNVIDENLSVYQSISDFYGLNKEFHKELLYGVEMNLGSKASFQPKRIVIVNKGLKQLLEKNPLMKELNTISFGVNVFKYIREEKIDIRYRPLIESLHFFTPFLESRRKILVDIDSFKAFMCIKEPVKLDEMNINIDKTSLNEFSIGPFIVEYHEKDDVYSLILWKGIHHINLLMKVQDLNFIDFRINFKKTLKL